MSAHSGRTHSVCYGLFACSRPLDVHAHAPLRTSPCTNQIMCLDPGEVFAQCFASPTLTPLHPPHPSNRDPQANQIMGLAPGEVFVQRNVGNQCLHHDMNVMACLEYAVKALKVGMNSIVTCAVADSFVAASARASCPASNTPPRRSRWGLRRNSVESCVVIAASARMH